jgi:hypothetical protein
VDEHDLRIRTQVYGSFVRSDNAPTRPDVAAALVLPEREVSDATGA